MLSTLEKTKIFRINLQSMLSQTLKMMPVNKNHTYQRGFVEHPKERKRYLLEDFEEKHRKIPVCNDDNPKN